MKSFYFNQQIGLYSYFFNQKGVVLTIETKHEHKIKELKQKIEKLELENESLKQYYNLSDNENHYDEYDNLNLELGKNHQGEENND